MLMLDFCCSSLWYASRQGLGLGKPRGEPGDFCGDAAATRFFTGVRDRSGDFGGDTGAGGAAEALSASFKCFSHSPKIFGQHFATTSGQYSLNSDSLIRLSRLRSSAKKTMSDCASDAPKFCRIDAS